MRIKIGLLLLMTLLGVSVWVVEKNRLFFFFKHHLQQTVIPTGMLASTKVGDILQDLHRIHVVPTDFRTFPKTVEPGPFKRKALFHHKRKISSHSFGLEQPQPEAFPSSTILHRHIKKKGLPVVSLVMDPFDLHDPLTGILKNAAERGKRWERPAFISFFDEGELSFAAGTGVRLHGGRSRFVSKEKSYRVYFRKRYGLEKLPPGVLFNRHDRKGPIRHFILHNDIREDWHLVNPMAYDISERIGALVPQTKPVQFFLNGEFGGVYVATEHLSQQFMRTRFGHDNFLCVRTKMDGGRVSFGSKAQHLYSDFYTWARAEVPITMKEAAQRVNLDNLTRWILSILVCAPTDSRQGIMALDMTVPNATWFTIMFDLDHSFQDRYHSARNPWEFDAFKELLVYDPRAALFHRLIRESPEYMNFFLRLFVDALNHRVTSSFLQGRFEHYYQIAKTYGVKDLSYMSQIRRFFMHRPDFLFQQVQRRFKLKPRVQCVVKVPEECLLEIDGYPERSHYRGWYFDRTPIQIKLNLPVDQQHVRWKINGRFVSDHQPLLTIQPRVDMVIEAFIPKSGGVYKEGC